MSNFFENPNLPSRAVKTLIIGETYCKSLQAPLSKLGVSVLSCMQNPFVDKRLASHADLSVYHVGGRSFVLGAHLKGSAFAEALASKGAKLIFSEVKQGSIYPDDANLCALNAGGVVFHNRKFCDDAIRLYASDFVHTAQGYCKCAVCMVTENAAITADHGMIKALENRGIEVLHISPEGVELEGFAQGLIGGAAFKLSQDSLAFTGSLSKHTDRARINDFLLEHKVRPLFLSDNPVFDIGSAIQVD